MTGTGTALEEGRILDCPDRGAPIRHVDEESMPACKCRCSATMFAGFDQVETIRSHSIIRPKVGGNVDLKAARDWFSSRRLKPRTRQPSHCFRSSRARGSNTLQEGFSEGRSIRCG